MKPQMNTDGHRWLHQSALCIFVALCLCGGCFASDDDFAKVTLSNGEQAEGTFSLTEGKKLEIFDLAKSKRIYLEAAEIARVSVTVEEEKLEQGWMFREEGFNDKLKLPFKYPLRKLFTDITLTSGITVHGRTTTVFYIENQKEEQTRYLLLANQKGEKAQTLNDLVYVKEIVLPNRVIAAGKLGTIKVPEPAAAVYLEREVSFQTPLTGLMPGHYDVFIFPQNVNRVRYGLTGGPVPAAELAAIKDKVEITEEFFPQKRVVDASKDGNIIRALLELTRPEGSHDAGWRYARWEVWIFEPTEKAWSIRKRLYLRRERFSINEAMPTFIYQREAKLMSVQENAALE
jgi:hypothetical protein